jgi:hypothetical protein
MDPDVDPLLVGYATLALDAIRLTNSEMKHFGSDLGHSDFGAVRIQMIGVDCRHQGQGFVANRAKLAQSADRERTTSMRLDLKPPQQPGAISTLAA